VTSVAATLAKKKNKNFKYKVMKIIKKDQRRCDAGQKKKKLTGTTLEMSGGFLQAKT
jgi:hypothetical protein